MSDKQVKPDDWVAFLRQAEIVYARVQYVRPMRRYPWEEEAVTSAGCVDVSDVLEVRTAPSAVASRAADAQE